MKSTATIIRYTSLVTGVMVMASLPALAAEGKSGLPQLDPTWYVSQIFWLAVHFFVLYLFSSLIILPRIQKRQQLRNEKVAHDKATGDACKEEVKRLRLEYEQALALARANANDLRNRVAESTKETCRANEEKVFSELHDNYIAARKKIDADILELKKSLEPTIRDASRQILQKLTNSTVPDAVIENAHRIVMSADASSSAGSSS